MVGGLVRRVGTVLTSLLLGVVVVAMPPVEAAPTSTGPRAPVIVRAVPGGLASAKSAVVSAGGSIDRELRIINGFSARVPESAIAGLEGDAAVSDVAADGKVTLAGSTPSSTYSPKDDFGSMFNVARAIGADKLWKKGASGQGIGVALIDTGVNPVPGLTGGNVVNGPDLSTDAGNANLRWLDAFGHGTHLAGIIGGRDVQAAYDDPSQFTGIAPDATLVNVKVGAADGSVDVSQVIAGLDWVVAHKDDPGVNIRVVNLSFGTDSTQDYRIDPLAYAAEAVWRSGVVVVASAGNAGNLSSVLTNPAINPRIIAVGADGHYDSAGKKQYIPSFSNGGNLDRSPDLVAPGQSIVSLRSPGSFVDTLFPSGRVDDAANRFFRGSGTSQATAIVSGVVADLLSKHPALTPDQVKGLLRAYAAPLPGVDVRLQGAGEVDASKLADLKPDKVSTYTQAFDSSDGSGSIEAARGSGHLVAADGTVLSGETTVFGVDFDGHSWSNNAWDAASWQGGSWDGHSWSGHSWSGDAWSGHSWSTDIWAGHSWSGNSWTGNSWTGNSWTGNSWTGNSWTGNSWTGNSWTGNSWTGNSWSGMSWG